MRRLHQLTDDELVQWKQARKAVGWERYGEDSYRRYNLVDVMEELMDAEVILDRLEERLARQEHDLPFIDRSTLSVIRANIAEAKFLITQLDEALPDRVCTDEAGGERIWWKSSLH